MSRLVVVAGREPREVLAPAYSPLVRQFEDKLRSGVNADLRLVPDDSFSAALHYFTGSKPHNIAIRTLGVKRGLKINEYGVFKAKKQVAGRTEQEVCAQLRLPYIEPELRGDWGEIDAAREGRLPQETKSSVCRTS